MSKGEVVLAFSGGLDTSFCVPYLKEQGYDVITLFVDTGGVDDAEKNYIATRARELGSKEHVSWDGAAAIWVSGQKVANNTIQIPLLARTNHLVTKILESAVRTAGAVAAVEHHAGLCPHCPACVIGAKEGGR